MSIAGGATCQGRWGSVVWGTVPATGGVRTTLAIRRVEDTNSGVLRDTNSGVLRSFLFALLASKAFSVGAAYFSFPSSGKKPL